jgi:hypothetical protein
MAQRVSRAGAVGVIGALCALSAPATAGAADLAVQGTCFASRQRVVLVGSAFTPGAGVAISGAVSGSARADSSGAFTTEITAPNVATLGPTVVTVRAADGVNPANTATVRLRVVRAAFGSNFPIAGRPRATTTWHFAGFAAGEPIYGHFLRDGRSRGDFRFGVATGPCGTLTVRAARIPGVRDLRTGDWTLKLDQRRRYRERTPGSEVEFRIRHRGENEGDGGGGPGPDALRRLAGPVL